jgi:hypothetical protein
MPTANRFNVTFTAPRPKNGVVSNATYSYRLATSPDPLPASNHHWKIASSA